jgi:K+-transporting ATPase KdpF subunit
VGHRLYCGECAVFYRCDWICEGMRPVEDERGAAMIETLSLGFVTVALLVYLVYALLRPEKF